VELHNLMLGRDLGANVEVLSGIGPNDKVIINPSDSLISGARVRMVEVSPKEMAERTNGGEAVVPSHDKASLDN
jgi:hypothetical protein